MSLCFILTIFLFSSVVFAEWHPYYQPGYHTSFPRENEFDMWALVAREKRQHHCKGKLAELLRDEHGHHQGAGTLPSLPWTLGRQTSNMSCLLTDVLRQRTEASPRTLERKTCIMVVCFSGISPNPGKKQKPNIFGLFYDPGKRFFKGKEIIKIILDHSKCWQ